MFFQFYWFHFFLSLLSLLFWVLSLMLFPCFFLSPFLLSFSPNVEIKRMLSARLSTLPAVRNIKPKWFNSIKDLDWMGDNQFISNFQCFNMKEKQLLTVLSSKDNPFKFTCKTFLWKFKCFLIQHFSSYILLFISPFPECHIFTFHFGILKSSLTRQPEGLSELKR